MLQACTSAGYVFTPIQLFFPCSNTAARRLPLTSTNQSMCCCCAWMTPQNRDCLWSLCVHVYLWFLVQQQTLVQMSQGSIHRLPDPFARRVDTPGLSICHALVPVWLHSLLESHKPGHRQLHPPTAAPHGHRLVMGWSETGQPMFRRELSTTLINKIATNDLTGYWPNKSWKSGLKQSENCSINFPTSWFTSSAPSRPLAPPWGDVPHSLKTPGLVCWKKTIIVLGGKKSDISIIPQNQNVCISTPKAQKQHLQVMMHYSRPRLTLLVM